MKSLLSYLMFGLALPVFSLAIFCSLIVNSSAQTTIATEIEALKSIYEQSLSGIDKEYSDKARNWPDEYLKELDVIQKKMQKAGDLDGWQVVNKEVTRFNSDKSIPITSIVATASDLQSIQKRYQVLSSGIETEKSKKIVSLTEKYVSRLATTQKTLTIAGKIDDALIVNSEIKRVKALPKVSAAEFALMTVEAEKAPEQKTPATSPGGDAKKTAEPTAKTDSTGGDAAKPKTAGVQTPYEPATEASGPKVHEGQTLPQIQGVTFKNISLSGTDRMRVSKSVAVVATVGKKSGITTSSSSTIYTATHERSGSIQNFIRVTVKTSNASSVLENGKMVIQAFGKNVSGKGASTELRTDVVKLPKLEVNKVVTVELPPVVTTMKSVRSISSDSDYGVTGASKTGKDFYGIVVSVFDEAGTIVYQGASSDNLEKLGIAEMPKEKPSGEVLRERFMASRDAFYQARSSYASSPGSETVRSAYLAASNDFAVAREAYFESVGSPVPPFPAHPAH